MLYKLKIIKSPYTYFLNCGVSVGENGQRTRYITDVLVQMSGKNEYERIVWHTTNVRTSTTTSGNGRLYNKQVEEMRFVDKKP